MAFRRKILYSFLVLGTVFLLIEGTARFAWWRLESYALNERKSRGERILRNDAINFMKQADSLYGYKLKPGTYSTQLWINEQGFPQRESIAIDRRPGFLRIACLGESTTFGNSSLSNYPAFLRGILERDGHGFDGYEVINGGVPGWMSEQIALRVKHEIAQYKPDVVILYVGWNDFQSYDPLAKPPQVSYFEAAYGAGQWKQRATSWLKSVALASALYPALYRRGESSTEQSSLSDHYAPAEYYRFLLQNLDQIVSDFRGANPIVRVFVCTLVGRWPQGRPEEYTKIPLGWAKQHKLSLREVVPYVGAFNDQLRSFARTRNLDLIDVAAAFQDLDRARLQFDWAHMISDGYELVAWTLFSALQKSGVVHGQEDQRYTTLLNKYRLNNSAAAKRY